VNLEKGMLFRYKFKPDCNNEQERTIYGKVNGALCKVTRPKNEYGSCHFVPFEPGYEMYYDYYAYNEEIVLTDEVPM
jgi:hypothetical protein